MAIETIPDTTLQYYLIAYDKHGQERQDDPSGLLSKTVRDALTDQSVTDVFIMCHGWKGDVPSAKRQYQAWISAMLACSADREKIRELRPDFKPLLIGLHWPSLPWGDENLAPSGVTFNPADHSIDAMIEDAADKTADTTRAKQALRVIFTAAQTEIAPTRLPDEVVDAYRVLYDEAGLAAAGAGAGASPGADVEEFDPERVYDQARTAAVSFGDSKIASGLLCVIRQLSFWKMKARARTFGESGAGALLRDLQQSVGEQEVRFHLMGHSFGCIVISAMVAGAGGDEPLVMPINSVFLVQGALSLWSFCSDIPVAQGTPGYFQSIAREGKVAGPIVITLSEHDRAVGKLYPLGAGLKSQIDFAPGKLPTYGGLGTFGARGPGIDLVDLTMLSVDQSYKFERGKFYNLHSSEIINQGEGLSGAHSDIAKPSVAHAFWEAAMVS